MTLVDITPLQSEHRLRGVGHYLGSLLETERFRNRDLHYFASRFGQAHLASWLPPNRLVRSLRPHRPAQVYWLYNEIALRSALARVRPTVLLAPDFNGLVANPYGATVAVLHDLTELKLSATARTPRSLSERLSDLRWSAYHAKLKRADHIIAISESVARDAVRYLDIDPEAITVIHHGVDHELFRASVGVGAYADRPPYFVHLGGRNPNKNPERLLHAFARVARRDPVVRLFFAGPWSAADLRWLEDQRRELGLEGRVEHLGYVPLPELPSLYGNALAFVFPSLEEGFGLPLLEAMASGAPVITSNRPTLTEVAGDAALFVDPLDVASIEQGLQSLLERDELRDALRRAGFDRAATFTWEATAARTLEVLELAGGEACA